jgi:hypothetical protein
MYLLLYPLFYQNKKSNDHQMEKHSRSGYSMLMSIIKDHLKSLVTVTTYSTPKSTVMSEAIVAQAI